MLLRLYFFRRWKCILGVGSDIIKHILGRAYILKLLSKKHAETTIDKAFYLLEFGTANNYGHFVMDCLWKLMVLEENNFSGSYLLYDSEFAREWIQLLSMEYPKLEEKVVWIDNHRDNAIEVRELWCADPVIETSCKAAKMTKVLSKKVKEWLIHDRKESNYNKRIYARRNGSRKLIISKELLDKYGFVVFEPENHSIIEQIRVFDSAEIVLCPHGAGATGCVFMRQGTFLIETFGAGFIDSFFVEMVKQSGVNYRMLVSQKNYQERGLDDDYLISPTVFEITMDEIEKTIGR